MSKMKSDKCDEEIDTVDEEKGDSLDRCSEEEIYSLKETRLYGLPGKKPYIGMCVLCIGHC